MQLSKITNKQQEILTLFLKFRFLTRSHIQQFLNHKDEKTIQTWLTDLVQKDYLEKTQEKHTNQFFPNTIVYSLGKNGIRFLKAHEIFLSNFLTNLYRDGERSNSFISRCFLIANICLELLKASTSKEKFEFFTRSDYIKTDSQFNFLTELHPNLYFTKKIKGGKTTWYLLEFFYSSLPSQEIRRRIHAYVCFLIEEAWIDVLGNNPPTILFICSSKEMQYYARQYTRKKLKKYVVEEYDISFALEEDAKKQGIRQEVWKELG